MCWVLVGSAWGHGPEIRWTTDGIPHVKAGNWRDLGLGVGYAQAGDALCTMAEAFVTFEGRRAYYFGPQAHPAVGSTFGTAANNLDLVFSFGSSLGLMSSSAIGLSSLRHWMNWSRVLPMATTVT